jgi:hypothetical protein
MILTLHERRAEMVLRRYNLAELVDRMPVCGFFASLRAEGLPDPSAHRFSTSPRRRADPLLVPPPVDLCIEFTQPLGNNQTLVC